MTLMCKCSWNYNRIQKSKEWYELINWMNVKLSNWNLNRQLDNLVDLFFNLFYRYKFKK